jgi:hypothetical protein
MSIYCEIYFMSLQSPLMYMYIYIKCCIKCESDMMSCWNFTNIGNSIFVYFILKIIVSIDIVCKCLFSIKRRRNTGIFIQLSVL